MAAAGVVAAAEAMAAAEEATAVVVAEAVVDTATAIVMTAAADATKTYLLYIEHCRRCQRRRPILAASATSRKVLSCPASSPRARLKHAENGHRRLAPTSAIATAHRSSFPIRRGGTS